MFAFALSLSPAVCEQQSYIYAIPRSVNSRARVIAQTFDVSVYTRFSKYPWWGKQYRDIYALGKYGRVLVALVHLARCGRASVYISCGKEANACFSSERARGRDRSGPRASFDGEFKIFVAGGG